MRQSLVDRVVGWGEHPRFVLHVLALVTLLGLPSLAAGFAGDDHFQRIVLDGALEPWIPSHRIFGFFPADPAAKRALVDRGMMVWWVGEGGSLDFFRPLTTLTHALDARLFPALAWPAHAQNLGWYLLFVAFAARVYARIEAGAVASLALLIFAIDDNHAIAMGWIANRNSVMAGAFAALSLWMHDRWRREGWVLGGPVAAVAFGLALCSAEAGLGALGYLAAYAWVLDRRRVWTLAPYGLLTVLWQLVYRAGGYGAHGFGGYHDPGADPVGFTVGVLVNLPSMLLAQLTLLPLDTLAAFPAAMPAVALVCAVLLALLVRVALPRLEREPTLAFWALGTLLSLVPLGAAFPQDRNLMLSGLGASAVVARVLRSAGQPRWLSRGLVLFQLVLPGLIFVPRSYMFPAMGGMLDRSADDLPTQGHAVLLNAPIDLFPMFLAYSRLGRGLPGPDTFHFLWAGLRPLTVRGVDAHTLELEPEGGWFRETGERFLLGGPLVEGQVFSFARMEATVGPMGPHGRPQTIRFRFPEPLSELHLYRWSSTELSPVSAPGPGESVVVPTYAP